MPRPFGSWVVENIGFKVFHCEGHAISTVEAALYMRAMMREKGFAIQNIQTVKVRTHEAAILIISNTGPLPNSAARDHCLQYILAVTLLKGAPPEVKDYADDGDFAKNEEVDVLRGKIVVEEDPRFTRDYHDPRVRSIASEVMITMEDGNTCGEILVEHPLGSPKRGSQTEEVVQTKCWYNIGAKLGREAPGIIGEALDGDMEVKDFVELFQTSRWT